MQITRFIPRRFERRRRQRITGVSLNDEWYMYEVTERLYEDDSNASDSDDREQRTMWTATRCSNVNDINDEKRGSDIGGCN